MRAVFRAVRANLRSHRLQKGLVFLTLAASALLLTLALTAYASGFRVYDRLMERTHGAHIWLSADPDEVSAEALAQAVQEQPEVVEATATMPTFRLALEAPDGKKVDVLAREFVPERTIARLLWVEGEAPAPHSNEIAIDRNLARVLELGLGDQVNLWVGDRHEAFTVSGTFITSEFCAYPNCQPARVYLGSGTLTGAMPPDSWDVGVRLREPQRAEEVLRALRGAFPQGAIEGYTWLKIRRYVGLDLQIQAVFILAFAMMAVLVAGFLIANTVAGAVRAQTRQIGLLRAVGFTNGQLAAIYLSEFLLVGALAAVAGMALGTPLADRIFARLSERYAAGTLTPPPGGLAVLGAAILALVAVAVAWPLRRIARLDTVTAIRRGAEPPKRRGVRLLRLPLPVAYGLSGLLARPGRTFLTTMGLAVGALAITVALSLGATVQTFASDPVGMGLTPDADVIVTADEGVSPDALLAALRDDPDVLAYACEGRLTVRVQGDDQDLWTRLVCGDPSLYANTLLEGRLPQAEDEVAAAYTIAHQHGWQVGDEITIASKGRTATFRIVGIYRDIDNLGHMLIIPADAFLEGTPPLFFVRLAPGTEPHAFLEKVKAQFDGRVDGKVVAEIFSSSESGMDAGRILRSTVLILSSLLGLLTAVGVLGSLSLNVYEERHTLGILKALGMTPAQVALAVICAAVAMALMGYAVGAPAGAAVAQALFSALARMVGLGPVPATIDRLGVALLLPALSLMAALGAYLPARRAARLSVFEVLQEE